MSDIDFDELDKAVNSLMANVDTSKSNEATDDPEDKVVTLNDPASEQSAPMVQPSAVTPEATPSDVPAATPAPSAPVASMPALAVKRRGQFMDVMHPSSNMKATKAIKREGVSLTPTTPEVAPMPDAKPTELAQPPVADSVVNEPVIEEPAADEPAPLSSPFLPDAKPEKRPLGVAADAITPQALDIAAELDNESTSSVMEQPAPTPHENTAALPPELQTDIVAIEAAETTVAEPAESVESVAASEAAVESPDVAPVPEEPTSVPAGGSITQQYTESPSSGDQTNGSIYDTANYHQPIEATPVAKKVSPLKWILISIGLLVVGGAVGVGYFLLTH